MRSAVHHADHGALVWAYLHRIRDAMQAGDVARADADLDRARPGRPRDPAQRLPLVPDGRRGRRGRRSPAAWTRPSR